MKALKPLLLGLLVVVLITAIALFYFLVNLDDIVKKVIEDTGSRTTGTAVTLDRAEIDLRSGRGSLYNLQIANPEGFGDTPVIALDHITVQVDPASLGENVTYLYQVEANGARLDVVQQGTTTNLHTLLEHIRGNGAEKTPAPAPTESNDTEPLVAIKELDFLAASASLTLDNGDQHQLKIPDIRLRDLGTRTMGLTPSQLSRKILNDIIRQAERAIEKEIKKAARDKLREEAKKRLGEGQKKLMDKLGIDDSED